jgi:anti-sigma regulatory factor (Ser/Thr protein kinase)
MAIGESVAVEVRDPSAVGDARRRVTLLASERGFGEIGVGRVAIAVVEAATNLLKHGGGGEIVARAAVDQEMPAVEILALDRGPGIPDLDAAFRDGYSSAGTSGRGLGAIRRASSEFDVYSTLSGGTALLAVLREGPERVNGGSTLRAAGVSVPKPGEEVSGDDWAVSQGPDGLSIMVIDGLGHGPGAAEAAREARRAFLRAPHLGPAQLLELLHRELRPTRGAAVAVARVVLEREHLVYAGVGNIAGFVLGGARPRALVSHNGILGHEARRFQEFTYPWPPDSTLVMHSDGLITHWDLGPYPGLLRRHPGLIAGVLYRDFRRQRDDTTVVVARSRRP